MKRSIFIFCACFAASLLALAQQKQPVSYVDPMIGSDAHGHVFVGANVPWGMVDAGPVQPYHGWDWCSGYHYSGDSIIGFSQTHLSGTGCSDLGDIMIMPHYGLVPFYPQVDKYYREVGSLYSHENEKAEAGYYSVLLDRYHIQTEITAAERAAMYRFTFPKGSRMANVTIDLYHGIGDTPTDMRMVALDPCTLVGYRSSKGWTRHTVYFCIQFDHPVREWLVDSKNSEFGQALLEVKPGEQVLARVGLSPVSEIDAMQNMMKEIPEMSFDYVRTMAQQKWNTELSRIQADFSDEHQERCFYTAMYHAMEAPQLWNDESGDYVGSNRRIYRSADFQNYSTWSLWDTYRALHPLAIIVMSDKLTDWAKTMMHMCDEFGELPMWHLHSGETYCMVGEPGVPVLADMILKGVKGIDYEKAYADLKQSMSGDYWPYGDQFRDDGINYMWRGKDLLWKYGYIPFDSRENETVAKSMEYYIASWAVAQVAGRLGHKEDSVRYAQMAQNYHQLYDKRVGFMRAKDSKGNFRPVKGFNPNHQTKDYTEGNPWHYLWLVPQDVPGLINLIGGKKLAEARLDSLFMASSEINADANPDISGLIGQYCQGNEPSHHTLFIYNYLGKPRKTQQRVHQVLSTLYTDKPDGLCGNEDVGQMSAWYIMASLGLYQVEPCGGVYQLCTPTMKQAVLQVGDGKTFTIKTKGKGIYAKRWVLNGKPINGTTIRHEDIMKGGTLLVELSK